MAHFGSGSFSDRLHCGCPAQYCTVSSCARQTACAKMAGVEQHKCLGDAVTRTRIARALALHGIAGSDVGYIMSNAVEARDVAVELLGDFFLKIALQNWWQFGRKHNLLAN